ncbi:endonuclease [Pseudomonas phage PaSzW-1]|uniref:Endonuclease n=1 Tax=Pseudomonas phage PaZq-1 TaxID=2419747 RepID=A0A411BE52_9CAUD|nr:endonuclease [Pseudomonas phage PaZq-1]QAX99805.1 endonuclease [Pseudomonas phage PaZq-1]QAY01718.1 endonuclease [Pseudomonas phage PaSzW-1]
MRILYLYKITNSVNGKTYLGVTFNPRRRWQQHQYTSSNCIKLRRAIAKYGKDNFKFEVLCSGTEEYILDLEYKAIIAYDSIREGYNTIPGGNRRGISLEEDTKFKIAKSLIEYYKDNESANRGRKVASRSDDKPLCVFGFWFPNVRTAIEALGINRKTIYSRRAEGTLHLEARPLKCKIRPVRGSEQDRKNRSNSMRGKNIGDSNGMYGKKNPSRARRVMIEGVVYDSITDAVKNTIYTKSQIEKRLSKGADGFEYIQ